jgi:hypothetical protein
MPPLMRSQMPSLAPTARGVTGAVGRPIELAAMRAAPIRIATPARQWSFIGPRSPARSALVTAEAVAVASAAAPPSPHLRTSPIRRDVAGDARHSRSQFAPVAPSEVGSVVTGAIAGVASVLSWFGLQSQLPSESAEQGVAPPAFGAHTCAGVRGAHVTYCDETY